MSLTSINVNNALVTSVDSEPTVSSNNLVKSGGVANKLVELEGKTVGVPIKGDSLNDVDMALLQEDGTKKRYASNNHTCSNIYEIPISDGTVVSKSILGKGGGYAGLALYSENSESSCLGTFGDGEISLADYPTAKYFAVCFEKVKTSQVNVSFYGDGNLKKEIDNTNKRIDEAETLLNSKESSSNKSQSVDDSTQYYPSNAAVRNYINSMTALAPDYYTCEAKTIDSGVEKITNAQVTIKEYFKVVDNKVKVLAHQGTSLLRCIVNTYNESLNWIETKVIGRDEAELPDTAVFVRLSFVIDWTTVFTYYNIVIDEALGLQIVKENIRNVIDDSISQTVDESTDKIPSNAAVRGYAVPKDSVAKYYQVDAENKGGKRWNPNTSTFNAYAGGCIVAPCVGGNTYYVDCSSGQNWIVQGIHYIDAEGKNIGVEESNGAASSSTKEWRKRKTIAPENAVKIVAQWVDGSEGIAAIYLELNGNIATTDYVDNEIEKVTTPPNTWWEGKKILFLGTSIPAGYASNTVTIDGVQYPNSYPHMLAKLLGATCYNESVGESCARAFNPRTGSFKGMAWTTVAKGLSQTVEEKQKLIDYWENGLNEDGEVTEGGTFGWRDLIGSYDKNTHQWFAGGYIPEHITDTFSVEQILDWSFERKIIGKYFDSSSPYFVENVDVVIIEHGVNDIGQNAGIAWETGKRARFYDNRIEDVIDDSNKGFDRTTYPGAMNFIINEIYKWNPKQKIVIFGHYSNNNDHDKNGNSYYLHSNKDREGVDLIPIPVCDWVTKAQESVARYWNIPIIRTWEGTKWNDVEKVSAYKEWNPPQGSASSRLVASDTLVTRPLSHWYLVDYLHPAGDWTGKANMVIAKYGAKILLDIFSADNEKSDAVKDLEARLGI